ncbi:MAG: hypothetical protein GF350_15260, partial [Chitinivibrionales bacterium]|nr:hypothetical protein [Chitinivibrionales bacterium]
RCDPNDILSLITLSLIIIWSGMFLLLYGAGTFRKALFPATFLLFTIPVPLFVLLPYVRFLQIFSTEAANILFKASRITYVREGFVFHLPQISIEVADVCSGIRSSLALLITSIIAGKLFLQKPWSKIILAVFVLPITVFKNGLRIAGLSILGTYVDERILHSEIHRQGGKPFFILALIFLGMVLWLLKRLERRKIV